LIIPSADQLTLKLKTFKESVLTRAPFGYATRIYDIIENTTATNTLPTLAMDVPDGLPLAGKHFDFTPWDKLAGVGSIMATDHADFLNTAGEWFKKIWLLGFAFWVIFEVFGEIKHHDMRKQMKSDKPK